MSVTVLEEMCAQRWYEPQVNDVKTRGPVERTATGEWLIHGESSIEFIRALSAHNPLESSVVLGHRLCYYEATFSAPERGSIGICSISKSSETVANGGVGVAFGYHGHDGYVRNVEARALFAGYSKAYGSAWTREEGADLVIGCGYCPDLRELFFTKDSRHLGTAVTSVDTTKTYAAAVTLRERGDSARINFGCAPFAFDV